MLDGSQGLFEELSFTIYPNGLSEDRLREVRDASKYDRHVTDALHRLNMPYPMRAAPLYRLMPPKAE